MAAKKYVQAQTLYLAGSGVLVAATSIVLTSLTDIYGNAITSITSFGDKGYITLEPDTSNEEGAAFTSVTANANGTVTLGGVSTILAQSPYTETSGLVRAHSGGTKVVITDNVAFWNGFGNKNNDETLIGRWGTAVAPSAGNDLANKTYVDGVAVAGAPNANTTTKGIVQEATQAQVDAGTTAGSTGADLFPRPDTLRSKLLSDYVVDTGAANAYVITPVPAIAAYATGQIFSFKAVNPNTTTSTLNVNGKGAITIKKAGGSANLVANDIIAGQIAVVEYDGTNFQLISVPGNPIAISKFGGTGADGALAISSGATNIDCANAAVVIKNYTSISITGTGSLTFTNPHTNGTIIIFKSQGNVTLTSSTAPMIDASNMGAAPGTAVTATSNNGVFLSGNSGNNSNGTVIGGGGGAPGTTSGPGVGVATLVSATISRYLLKYAWMMCGAGAGSGAAIWITGQTSGTSGAGGLGGGGLIIECAGAWNFTTASGISVAGQNGGNASAVGVGLGGGGGGGGAAGFFLALYNILTASSGTVTVTGGTGGNNNNSTGGNLMKGGAGGGNSVAGSSGTSSVTNSAKTGGDGAVGQSIIALNTEYD